MLGAVFGFGAIKVLQKIAPGVPFLGMEQFGPQENSIIQAAATGSGGMTGLFIAALPAMYRLDLLTNPKDDFPRILTLTLVASTFGLFFAVPLRKFFIINVARELRLIFPSCKISILLTSSITLINLETATATAVTIRSMHAVGTGATEAIKKIKALGIAFGAAIIQRVVSYYAIGILYDWHIFTWFFIAGNYNNYAIVIENWGWIIEWTPAFFGSGMLVGLNTAISMFAGTFFAWGFMGPILIKTGICVGKKLAPEDPQWSRYVSYYSMSGIQKPGFIPSPRYWFLWPGVAVLVAYSMTEFLAHWKVIYYGARYAWVASAGSINALIIKRGGNPSAFLEKQAQSGVEEDGLVKDFAGPEQQTSTLVWVLGGVGVIIITCIIGELQYHINAGLSILALILGVLFAFLSIHGAGVTDLAPLTASAKASQLVFGGITSHQGLSLKTAQTTNLIAGGIASGSADVATSLVGDYRVGFLLRTPPNLQWWAQALGTVVAMFLAPGIFVLFMAAYPCVLHPDDYDTCPFSAPSVTAWQAVAEAVTVPNPPIPFSSGVFALVLAGICVLQVILKNVYLVGPREKYRNWLPNWMAIGVAFVIPQTYYSTATLGGAIISHFWEKRNPKNFERYCFAVAAGLIAGEGLGGVIGAALQLGGVAGDVYGTNIGCPLNSC